MHKSRIRISKQAVAVFNALEAAGASVYIVGGAVRDYLLHKTNKDFDVEVFHITYERLVEVLSEFGHVSTYGASFAVVTLDTLKGYEFALPRKEFKTGEKHQDFKVEIDPDLPLEIAASRRDFTINAMMYEFSTSAIYDFYDGMADLGNRVLRMVNRDKFGEDPLRVLRGASFIARYGLNVEEETKALCAKMVAEGALDHLSDERVYEEYCKILMTSRPSVAFEFLKDINALPPYIKALVGTHQRKDYHPEGDVFTHTMLVVDIAALTKEQVANPLGFMWSALLHDIGKPYVTDENGRAINHDKKGAEVFDSQVHMIHSKEMRTYIKTMIYYHMRLMTMVRHNIRPVTYIRLLKKLENKVDVEDLMMLSRCDKLGRGNIANETVNDFDFKMAQLMEMFGKTAPVALVDGNDLIKEGFDNFKEYSELLKTAYDLQLTGLSKENILRRLHDDKR